jgi:cytochrome bd ubiquinol oxidase subunit II
MGSIWFWLVAMMMVAYVIFDGFDIGVGILHLFVARSEKERQLTLRSIGPVWDGNEVWLIAGGGTLYFAFPLLYASAFSGFYLALMMVLWLLILRGVAIELRMQVENTVWRAFFDGLFFCSSLLLAVFFGAALGNVIRGVPMGDDGYFFLPLWTNWRVGSHPGILDWFSVMGGLLALAALALHGALYLTVKTDDALHQRANNAARRLWISVLVLTVVSVPATIIARPDVLRNYESYPAFFVIPAVVLFALIGVTYFSRQRQEGKAFACSCLYLGFMLLGAAVALYPRLLPSSDNADRDITIEKALAGPHALRVGLVWWTFGICVAVVYFVIVYRTFRGKVKFETGGYEH